MNLPKTVKEFPLGAIPNPLMDTTIPAHGLEALRVNMQTLGTMLLCFDAQDDARVIAAGESHLLPQRIERVGNTLLIESRKLTIQRGQTPQLLIEVHVPAHVRVEVHLLAGVLMLNGGTGDVRVDGKFGEVCGVTFAQNVAVRLQSGNVTFNDLCGVANIRVSFGAVTLGWEKFSGEERVNVACGCGSIDLRIPATAANVSDTGGLFRQKTLRLPNGTLIQAQVNMGALAIAHWQPKRSVMYGLTV